MREVKHSPRRSAKRTCPRRILLACQAASRGADPHGLRGTLSMWPRARCRQRPALFGAVHAAISVGFLVAIFYVWWCVVTRRRDLWVRLAVAALAAEGAVV